MATDFTGTNTDKTDKLVAVVIELRTTLRIWTTIIGFGFPILVGLVVFLVTKTFDMSAKLDRIADRLDRIEKTLEDQGQRITTLEGRK